MSCEPYVKYCEMLDECFEDNMEDITPENIDKLMKEENCWDEGNDKDETYEKKREYLIESRKIAWYEEMNLI